MALAACRDRACAAAGLSGCRVTSQPSEVLDRLVQAGEESGAAVAVVRDGVVEVDHSAGTRDGTAPWTSDTLVMTFSVAKPFAALAFLDAVREGAVGLDQPVASVWPEYARAGKDATTMRHLLSHQAGLPTFPEEALRVGYDDREALVELLARASPLHPPGAGVAEHALTYGHLLDEVLRRATGTPLVERFERIVAETGWDLHLRVDERDLPRVATLVETEGAWRSAYLQDPRWGPALGRPPGLLDPEVLNSERFRRTPFPAIGLHASALSLATFYDELTRPEGFVAQHLGRDLWQAYLQPAVTGHDLVLDRSVTWTLGLQLGEEHGRVELGMGGAGGCSAWTEPAARYGAAYLTRRLGGHERGDAVWHAITARFRPAS